MAGGSGRRSVTASSDDARAHASSRNAAQSRPRTRGPSYAGPTSARQSRATLPGCDLRCSAMARRKPLPATPVIVLDDVFVLDPARSEDAPADRRFALDPDAARFFGWTVEQACAQADSHYEEGIRRSAREWRDGTCFSLTIRRRSNGEPVGSVQLRPRPESHGDVDVAYMVAPELRGRGIAPTAVEAMLAWGAQELGLRRAHIGCHVDNLASRRVAEKCGFELVTGDGDELRFRRDIESSSRPRL
jgi:RimJ/RimL family protein N-acetyltransferase